MKDKRTYINKKEHGEDMSHENESKIDTSPIEALTQQYKADLWEYKEQGNAISDAVIYVEVRGQLHEIKKMEVHENSQTIFGLNNNHQSHRLVMKTGEASNIIIPDELRTPGA